MRYKGRGMPTVAFILRRLFGAIPTLALVVALSFLLTRLAPGGPFDEEQALAPEIRANLEAAYGLDQPVHVQFGRYVRGLLHGDFGPSFKFRDFTVSELIAGGLPVSLTIGLRRDAAGARTRHSGGHLGGAQRGAERPTGSSWRSRSRASRSRCSSSRRCSRSCSASGSAGCRSRAGCRDVPTDLVLPVVSLALPVIAFVARLMRGSLLEVLRAPWIRAARARGLPERTVILRHALPAALLPVVSYVGPAAAAVLAGSLVVETLFGLPGMGRHLVQGALNRDYTLVMGMVIVYATLMIVLNLAADLAYAWLDPRIRRERRLVSGGLWREAIAQLREERLAMACAGAPCRAGAGRDRRTSAAATTARTKSTGRTWRCRRSRPPGTGSAPTASAATCWCARCTAFASRSRSRWRRRSSRSSSASPGARSRATSAGAPTPG